MTTEHFDDEFLSDVLDGAADEHTIAAVNADPAARARLARLRAVSDLVGTPPPPATPDRRARSIAAALEAASTAPEVSSLAPTRQARLDRRRVPQRWIAVAAAAVLAVLAVPIIGSIGNDDTVDTAAELASDGSDNIESGSQSLGGDLDGGDAGLDDSATEPAAEESAVASAEGSGAEAADLAADGDDSIDSGDEAADSDAFTTSTVAANRSIQNLIDPSELESFIDTGMISPEYAITDPVIVENVNSECLDPFAGEATESFGLARLAPPDEPERIVLVYFADSGEITAIDGEDCSPFG